jgi:hypothetical protein
MPARTITIAGLGDFRQLQTELERTGVIADKSGTTIANSSKRAGAAAAEQAKLVGLSSDQQVAAAGRAAAAFVDSQEKMSRAQRAAGTAAAEAGRAAGLSADQQVAAARRAADAQKAAADEQIAASKKTADAQKASAHAHSTVSKVGGVVALGAVGAAVEAVKLGEGFQTAQASIQGATSQSVKEVGKLTSAFETLGTGSQAAVGDGQQMEAAYAGVAGQLKLTEGHALSTAEATKFSAAANNLAESGAANLAEAYGATAKVMQTFHLSADQAASVTDTLYSTSKAVHVPVEQIASAMGKLHAALGAVAPSMQDVSGFIVALGGKGLTGGRGIQVVSSAMQTMLGSSKPVATVLKDLGVTLTDSSGKFIGMQNAIALLQPKLAALPESERRYAEQTLLGKGATEKLGQVILAGVPAFQAATAAANRHAAAQKAAEAQSKTFKDEMKALGNTVKTLGGDLGLVLIPPIQHLSTALSGSIQWLEKHKAAAKALAVVITGALGAAVTVFAVDKAAAFGKGVAGMVSGLKLLVVQSTTTAGEVGTADGVMVGETDAAAASMKAALLTTGIGAALVLLGYAAFELSEHWEAVMTAMEKATEKAANAIIDALNKAKQVVEDTASLGVIPLLQATGVIHGSVVPNIPHVSGSSGTGFTQKQEEENEKEGTPTAAARSVTSLQNLGIGSAASRGVVKALMGETNKDLEKGASEEGKEGAYGIAQWLGPRRAGLEAFAKSKKQPKSSLEVQLEYLAKELKGPEHGTLTALQHAHGTNEAAGIFIKNFERPENAAGVEQRAAGYSAPSGSSNAALQKQKEEQEHGKAKKTAAALGIPTAVATMLSTAQALIGAPYTSGGGHGSSANDPIEMLKKIGVDCSGFVSKVLSNKTGLSSLSGLTTEGLASSPALAKGAGKYVTLYDHANAGSQSHVIADILGKWFESGGGPKGVHEMSKAEVTATLQGGGFQVLHPKADNAPVKGGLTTASATAGSGVFTQIANAEAAATAALMASAKKMLGEGTGRGNLESAIQSGGVPQLEKILGVSTAGKAGTTLSRVLGGYGGKDLSQRSLEGTVMPTLAKSAEGTPTGKAFDRMVAELRATHVAGMVTLANDLTQAHKQALADLGRELYAVTQEKQAAALTNEATELKDRTTQATNTAAKQLDIVKAEATRQTDAMQAATKQVEDATQQMKDSFSEMVEAVGLATQKMSDAASGEVTKTQDQTAIKVAELAERGKYGLDLIAQKLEVQLDQMKAQYDVQIDQAKMALDQAKISGQQLIAEKQQQTDLVQAHEDLLAAAAQAQADNQAVTSAITLSMAQGTIDAIQLAADGRIDTALLASVMVATGTKAQQDAAKGFETVLKGKEAFAVAGAESALHVAEGAANAANTSAQTAYAVAQAQGAQAVADAQQALAAAEGSAHIAIANAEQGLGAIEGTAHVAEAGLEGKLAIERERSQTQYAGSGLTVQMYGMDYGNAEANANALTWALTHQLPV